MTNKIDPVTLKKLAVVRQMYHRAESESFGSHSAVNSIASVIGFDWAIEATLATLVVGLDPSQTPKDRLNELIQQADSLLQAHVLGVVPDKGNVHHVRSIRNDAQHRGKYPTESETSDCRTYTRDFLQRLLHQVWGCTLESISLNDLVQNPTVRQFLIDADDAIVKGKYIEAVNSANAALSWITNRFWRRTIQNLEDFDNVIGQVRDSIRGRNDYSDTPAGREKDFRVILDGMYELKVELKRDIADVARALLGQSRGDLYQAFDIMVQTGLGLNYADILWLRSIGGCVARWDEDKPIYTDVSDIRVSIDRNLAERILSYCRDAVIQIESRSGDIVDSPLR